MLPPNSSNHCRSQWPRGLRRRSVAACLLRLWLRIPPGAWMSVCCECCVFSGRGLCDEPITRPEESYRLWCIVVCDLEISRMRRPWPAALQEKKGKITAILPEYTTAAYFHMFFMAPRGPATQRGPWSSHLEVSRSRTTTHHSR